MFSPFTTEQLFLVSRKLRVNFFAAEKDIARHRDKLGLKYIDAVQAILDKLGILKPAVRFIKEQIKAVIKKSAEKTAIKLAGLLNKIVAEGQHSEDKAIQAYWLFEKIENAAKMARTPAAFAATKAAKSAAEEAAWQAFKMIQEEGNEGRSFRPTETAALAAA